MRIRRGFFALTTATWIAFGLYGCSSDDPKPAVIDEQTFRDQYFALHCRHSEACCPKADFKLANCLEKLAEDVDYDNQTHVFQPEAAGLCLEQWKRIGVDCDYASDADSACRRVYLGTLAVGETCTTSGQCAPDPTYGVSYCYRPCPPGVSECEATCLEVVKQPSGSCGVTADKSAYGPCEVDEVCKDATNEPSTCQPLPKASAGDPCDDTSSLCSNCTSEYSCTNLRCDHSSHTCAPFLGEGEHCSGGGCAEGLNCVQNTCTEGPGDGEACEESTLSCRVGYSCIDKVCKYGDVGYCPIGM